MAVERRFRLAVPHLSPSDGYHIVKSRFETMNDVVLLGKALSDATRVRILGALLDQELCVCEMVDALEMGQSTLSSHLQIIRQSGLVTTTRRHKMVAYELTEEAHALLRTIFEANAEALASDKRLKRDKCRIKLRLGLRSNGMCVLGPGQLDYASTNLVVLESAGGAT